MPKIETTCINCQQPFSRFPSAFAHAESRGTRLVSCSRKCFGEAKSKGLIGGKKRRGETLICEACGGFFYRNRSYLKSGRSRFCSETCRQKGFTLKLIDRTLPRPERLLGQTINCMFCGEAIYRKKSMLTRNIGKTCGKRECVAAYGRSLWGLSPREYKVERSKRKKRASGFTAIERRKWLDDKCARCGAIHNLMLDHKIPVCAGGPSIRENAQTLCGPCNNWKAKQVDRPLARQQSASGAHKG